MSDRSALIKRAASLPKGSKERRDILAGLSKKARGGSLTITVDFDRSRDGQPYVEFDSRGGKERYYQVKQGVWRNATGLMPLPELMKLADMLLTGKF